MRMDGYYIEGWGWMGCYDSKDGDGWIVMRILKDGDGQDVMRILKDEDGWDVEGENSMALGLQMVRSWRGCTGGE